MEKYNKKKVKIAINSVDKICLHCEKCEKSRCPVYNAYGQLEKIK
jgi:hypothetical protein